MILFLAPIIVGILAEGVLSGGHGYRDQSSCDNACFSGFTDIPGIASLCNNANRPTKTIEVSVTALTTSAIIITIPEYRFTDDVYTTPTPTQMTSCVTTSAPFTKTLGISNLIVGESYAASTTTPLPLTQRDGTCPSCPPVKEAVTSACKCFYPPGPEQTVYQNNTVTTLTSYVTYQTVSFNYGPTTRTLAAQCTPGSVSIYGHVIYNTCSSPGIPLSSYTECKVPFNTTTSHGIITNPYGLDSASCCTACANTLDCFQAFTDSSTNTCILNLRTAKDATNKNVTADCPNGHTFVGFGDLRGSGGQGFIGGHCAQGC